jgi:HEAT repeat protein
MAKTREIPFDQIITSLLDSEQPFPPQYLHRFSDLGEAELRQLKAAWSQIAAWRRQALLEDIESLNENDLLLSFEGICRIALQDEQASVRLSAVRTLWEYEDSQLAPLFIRLAEQDQSQDVRAASTSALGRFIYLGELDEIPASQLKNIEESLFRIYNSQDSPVVRQNALESLGFSSRDEVPGWIETAYQSGDKEWIASALVAMGRSADDAWRPAVLDMLASKLPIVRCEAARAAGELEIQAARGRLIDLLDDPDQDTRQASIWSLSQIGGERVQEILERLLNESDNEDERQFINEALENLVFTEGGSLMPILDFPDDGDLDEDWEDDPEEEEDDLD